MAQQEPAAGVPTLPGAKARRVVGVLGLVGVACTTASAPVMPIWGFPGTSASPAVIVRFVTTHHDRLLAGMMLNIAGVVLWTVLGAGVWRRVRTAAEPTDPATACLAAGLVGFVTLILTGFAVFTVFVARLPDPRFARLMYDLTFGLLAISGAPTAVCLVGFAVVAWRTACFPRATIGIAIVAAAAHVVLVFSLVVPSGFFSLDGQIITAAPATLFTWLAACAVVLLGRYDPVQVLAPHLLGRHHDDSRR